MGRRFVTSLSLLSIQHVAQRTDPVVDWIVRVRYKNHPTTKKETKYLQKLPLLMTAFRIYRMFSEKPAKTGRWNGHGSFVGSNRRLPASNEIPATQPWNDWRKFVSFSPFYFFFLFTCILFCFFVILHFKVKSLVLPPVKFCR